METFKNRMQVFIKMYESYAEEMLYYVFYHVNSLTISEKIVHNIFVSLWMNDLTKIHPNELRNYLYSTASYYIKKYTSNEDISEIHSAILQEKYVHSIENKRELVDVRYTEQLETIKDSSTANYLKKSKQKLKIRITTTLILQSLKDYYLKYQSLLFQAVCGLLFLFASYGIYSYIYRAVAITPDEINHIYPGNKSTKMRVGNKEFPLTDASVHTLQSLGFIYNNSQIAIENKQDSSTIMLDVPAGQQLQIRHMDVSTIWLNANSRLTIHRDLANNEVSYLLQGEGYFDMSATQYDRITIITNGQQVQGKGAKFNIKTYPLENYIVNTVNQGILSVESESKSWKLKAGQQGSVYDNGHMITIQVDPSDFIAWKEGYFSFTNASVKEIMSQLSQWYDFSLDYHPENEIKERFTGRISNATPLPDILKILNNMNINLKILKRKGDQQYIISNK